jgi:hypothetical protein
MLRHVADLFQGSWRYATGLRGFLTQTIDLEDAEVILTHQLQHREESFLLLLKKGVYGYSRSPYRELLLHAGFEFEDVETLVHEVGLDAALSKLYDMGVYVTLDEFKGRTPIRRPGLEFHAKMEDFDNPLLTAHYYARTGGSRSGGNRVPFDFDFLAFDAAAHLWDLHAHGIADRPIVLCLAVPPSAQGLSNLLRMARANHMPVKWFTATRPGRNRQGLQGRALLAFSLLGSRLIGRPIPRPEFLPESRMQRVVEYLVDLKQQGRPAVLYSVPGQAVRVCLEARDMGADISGTVFYGGGEPFTAGKAAVLEQAGVRGLPHYGLNEIGRVSLRCDAPRHPDDMHLQTGKLALLTRSKQLASGPTVSALYYTSLLTSTPKLMLNVESGDYADVEERVCGCSWGAIGFTTHLSNVLSYEKLSSEGVTFMGSMLYRLLEEELPAHFGGRATDYQLVEEEEEGVPRISLVVSPQVGPIDEAGLLEFFTDRLAFSEWNRRMAEEWRRAGTLRVRRIEPYVTGAAKILPLHVLGSSSGTASRDAHHV